MTEVRLPKTGRECPPLGLAGSCRAGCLRPQSDVGDGDPGSRQRPFVKRDLSSFPGSNGPFREREGPDGSLCDRSGDCPAASSRSGTVSLVSRHTTVTIAAWHRPRSLSANRSLRRVWFVAHGRRRSLFEHPACRAGHKLTLMPMPTTAASSSAIRPVRASRRLAATQSSTAASAIAAVRAGSWQCSHATCSIGTIFRTSRSRPETQA